jgi:NAD(P)H-flavin reductase
MPEGRSDVSIARARWDQDRLLVQACFAVLAPRLDTVIGQFYARLFALAPETRRLFPLSMTAQRARFTRVLTHLVLTLEHPAEMAAFLRQLAADHRKFGVEPRHYPVFGHALLTALADGAGPAWTPATAAAWQRLYAWIAGTMTRAMTTAAATDTGPASYTGHVTGHHRLDRDTAVVEVHPHPPLLYQPGQYLSVEIPQRPRLWRYLSPTTATRAEDPADLIFYVKALGSDGVARAIVSSTRIGDRWRLGPPQGELHHHITPHPPRSLLLIGGGTGIAPILSILDHLSHDQPDAIHSASWVSPEQAASERHPPAATSDGATGTPTPRHSGVVVCYGAPYRRQLHALAGLRELTYDHPWLQLLAVTEEHPAPAGFHTGTLADVVTHYGAWTGYEVIISGSPAMLRHTVARMLVAGTAANDIHYDPFVHD